MKGTLIPAPSVNAPASRELRVRMFRDLLRIRMVEEKIVEFYPQEEMRCPVHLSIGQEAVAVGVSANLTRDDLVMSYHRSHGHYLAKGGDLKAFIAELYGRSTGCCGGRGGSMHLVDLDVNFIGATPIVGQTIPIAAGLAFASKLRGESRLTVTSMGDAAVEEGVFHETLNFASLKGLPIVFVCENNLYSTLTRITERQPRREIFTLAQAHGIQAFQGDGNDVLEVYEITRKAKAMALSTGPVFLEFLTYRWREHVGPNDDTDLGYRTEAEVLAWKKRCPVERLKARLLEEGILDPEAIGKMRAEFEAEIDDAFRYAKKSPLPKGPLSVRDVYAD